MTLYPPEVVAQVELAEHRFFQHMVTAKDAQVSAIEK
jgi:hypothetical protein